MAKRRRLDISIIESDRFRLLTPSAQALYLHLNMNADDDGIVDKWKSILRCLGIRAEHLQTLINEEYVIRLPGDTLLIADWNIHNKIRRDRYCEGNHKDKLDTVLMQPNGRYFKA